uniref:Uncharacterized protein n=1 Tax=Glossina austeni TaxID=7395 RepID=A0A1A9VL42_GLOAU
MFWKSIIVNVALEGFLLLITIPLTSPEVYDQLNLIMISRYHMISYADMQLKKKPKMTPRPQQHKKQRRLLFSQNITQTTSFLIVDSHVLPLFLTDITLHDVAISE